MDAMLELGRADGGAVHGARDEVFEVGHRVALRLRRERGVVERCRGVLREVGRVRVLLHQVREDLLNRCSLVRPAKLIVRSDRTSFRASFDGGFRFTTSWNRCDELRRGWRDAWDSAAARRTTPLALGAPERAEEPNRARNSSVTCRVWNESACCQTFSLRWDESASETHLELGSHELIDVVEDEDGGLVPGRLVHPVLHV